MFEDVCGALAETVVPARIIIVTGFARAAEYSRRRGWEVILEEAQQSESASIDWAAGLVTRQGVKRMLRIPADVPLVKGADIDALLAHDLEPPGAVLVPSRDGMGTNAIVRAPAQVFPSRFGPGSLALHLSEAARSNAHCLVMNNCRLAVDIDDPSDLEFFLECEQETGTSRVLSSMKVRQRLKECREKSIQRAASFPNA
jgi:2-phospho-L-lactate guanylyltransferase